MPATTDRLPRAPARRGNISFGVLALGLVLAIFPGYAAAQESDEVQSGAGLLRSVEDGQRDCSNLGDTEYEAVGEYAMERMLGSAQAHQTMDRMMVAMMGERGLAQMHRFMGQRFAQCGGTVPQAFGGMMGTIGMMGGGVGMGGGLGPGGDGEVGPGGSGIYGPGMMGASAEDNDGWGGGGWLLAAFMFVLIAGLILVWAVGRRPAPGSGTDARSILDRRLAGGEIDRDEYEQRRSVLGGS